MSGRFICPIDYDWAKQSSWLPGKAFHVATCVWYLAGVTSSKEVRLSMKQLREFGITRTAAYRSLIALQKADLIKIERQHGCLPVVTVLDAKAKATPRRQTVEDILEELPN